jgi:hypothetical protein
VGEGVDVGVAIGLKPSGFGWRLHIHCRVVKPDAWIAAASGTPT